MASRAAKHQRTSTNGNGNTASTLNVEASKAIDFLSLLKDIPETSIYAMLDVTAKRDSFVADLIRAEHKRLFAASQKKIVDFGYLSKSAWKSINVDYCGMSGSKQFDMSGNAFREVKDCIDTIDRECPDHASFGTKRSALETLRKIGKSICLSGDGDVVGHEVRKSFQYDTQLEDTMYNVAMNITPAERESIMKTELKNQLYELKELGDSYYVFEQLDEVIAVLEGRAVEEGGDEAKSGESFEDQDSID